MIHRLAILLKKHGAKAALSRKTGISQAALTELCKGTDNLNDRLIKKISEGLGIPAWHLFVDPDDAMPENVKEHMAAYLSLDESGRRSSTTCFSAPAHGMRNPRKITSPKRNNFLVCIPEPAWAYLRTQHTINISIYKL